VKRQQDPRQLLIEWPTKPSQPTGPNSPPATSRLPLIQRLKWDFQTTFPRPTDEAIENGKLDESDREPENLKSLHENYSAQCLATLAALDKVMDARRRRVDPATGKVPRTHSARERLRKYLAEEPGRLEHAFAVLIGTYEEGFGQEAAEAFRKAIIAWHAGVEVSADHATPHTRRIRPVLPVPKPLRSSVDTAVFGRDEHGKPIRPRADEVRAITETLAATLEEYLCEGKREQFQSAVARYTEDFGDRPARQLEAYVRHQYDRSRQSR